MSCKIETIPRFDKDVKKLKKRFPKIKDDLTFLIDKLSLASIPIKERPVFSDRATTSKTLRSFASSGVPIPQTIICTTYSKL